MNTKSTSRSNQTNQKESSTKSKPSDTPASPMKAGQQGRKNTSSGKGILQSDQEWDRP